MASELGLKAYLFQSKICLLELNAKEAIILLDKTEELAIEKNLAKLREMVKAERELLQSQWTIWKKWGNSPLNLKIF